MNPTTYTSNTMISTDAAGNVLANAVGTDSIPRFHVSLYSGAMPTTAAALAGAWTSPLLTYKNLDPTGSSDYAILWDTPATNSRILTRDPSITAAGTGLSAAGLGTVATWLMIHGSTDNLSASSSVKRYAFSVGTSGTEVIMSNPNVVEGTQKYLDFAFALTFNDS